MNCCGGPAADGGATVEEDFEQAYHPEVVNLQTGDAGGPLLQGLSQVLEEGEIDMDVECRSLQGGEAVQHAQEATAYGGQMLQSFLQAEVAEVVGADLGAQEGQELLILLDEGVLPVSAEDMVPMLDLLQGRVKLAAQAASDANAEDLREVIGGPAPDAQFAGALEETMDGEGTLKDEVAAILHLAHGIEVAEIHRFPLAVRKLGTEHQGPVFQPLSDALGSETVGGGL